MLNEILEEIRNEILKYDVANIDPDQLKFQQEIDEESARLYRALPKKQKDDMRAEFLGRAVHRVMCLEEIDQLF